MFPYQSAPNFFIFITFPNFTIFPQTLVSSCISNLSLRFFCSFTFACSQNKKKQQCLTYYSFYTSSVIICPSICHLQPFKKYSRCCHFPAAKQNATRSDQSEILVNLTTSKLVWSSACFHLRQQCVVKWNTLDCWFQPLLKLPFCFLLMFLSDYLQFWCFFLFSRLVESILSGQCWDVEMTQSCCQPFSFSNWKQWV